MNHFKFTCISRKLTIDRIQNLKKYLEWLLKKEMFIKFLKGKYDLQLNTTSQVIRRGYLSYS